MEMNRPNFDPNITYGSSNGMSLGWDGLLVLNHERQGWRFWETCLETIAILLFVVANGVEIAQLTSN